jgi:hypothetical protein
MIMKDQETTKLEFLMMVNNNIIVQRFFNVRNYIPEAKNSLEFYEYLYELKGILEYDLKMKATTYLLDNSYEIKQNPMMLETSNTDGPEHFNIFIKDGDMTICHRQMDAKIFPPKIRYTVDIRPHIKSILSELTDIFSTENLTYEYLGIPTKP